MHTWVVVVRFIEPLDDAEHLEYVEGVEHFLHKEKVVWLHWNVNRIGTVTEMPGEEAKDKE